MLAKDVTWFIPACFDALSGILAQQAGSPFAFISGYGIAATRLGRPDVGLVTATEMVDTIRYICGSLPGFPFVADGDTGYGTAMNVRRTVVDYARAGAAAIMIEDQVNPKRCGHFDDKQVISREEARLKIRAAVEARDECGLDILIAARTDAIAPLGFDEALARIIAFENEGADILFMEALETEAQMRMFCDLAKKPTWANNFKGGRTPYLTRKTLVDIGFRFVTDPTLLFTATRAMQSHLKAFVAGNDDAVPPGIGFGEMRDLLKMPQYISTSNRYKS